MTIYAIIPARYDSTRFPGKPLADINGSPMFKWVYDACKSCHLIHKTILATDDIRIFNAAKSYGYNVHLNPFHEVKSGTDRVYECAIKLDLKPDDLILNVQGDEPLITSEHLSSLIQHMLDHPRSKIATLATPIGYPKAISPDTVKVVFNNCNQALYFSRQTIPHNAIHYHKHIGIYAFRLSALSLFCNLPPSSLETSEKLEQLRALQHGITIDIVITQNDTISVDTPQDLNRVISHLSQITQ